MNSVPESNRLLPLEYLLLRSGAELRVHLLAFVLLRMTGGTLAFDGRWLLCVLSKRLISTGS